MNLFQAQDYNSKINKFILMKITDEILFIYGLNRGFDFYFYRPCGFGNLSFTLSHVEPLFLRCFSSFSSSCTTSETSIEDVYMRQYVPCTPIKDINGFIFEYSVGRGRFSESSIRDYCCTILSGIPVADAVKTLLYSGSNRSPSQASSRTSDCEVSREQFRRNASFLIKKFGNSVPFHEPSDNLLNDVFDFLCQFKAESIGAVQLFVSVSCFCNGTPSEKTKAIFGLFDLDQNGFIEFNEMAKLLRSVYKAGLTDKKLSTLKEFGIVMDSPEELAENATKECFRSADLNRDNKLTFEEFDRWVHSVPKRGADPQEILKFPLAWIVQAILYPFSPSH